MIPGKEQFERDFEDFLKEDDSRLAALYRKLPQAEPDARTDAAVLAMAHRALNPTLVATPLPSTARRRARWLPALGAAAGLVLAAGVALRVGPQIWNNRNEDAPAALRKDEVIEVRPVDAPAPPPPPMSPAPSPESASSSPVAANAVGELRARKPMQPPRESAAKTAVQESAAQAPELKAESSTVDAKALDAAPNAPRPAAAQAFAVRQQPEMDAVERKEAIAKGAWQTLPENAARDSATSAGAGAAAAAATTAAPAGLAAPREKKAEVAQTPDAMIERIRRELREDHRQAALRDLDEFRHRYPEYTLPQDLRDLK